MHSLDICCGHVEMGAENRGHIQSIIIHLYQMLELKVIAGVSSLKHEQHGDMHILYIL